MSKKKTAAWKQKYNAAFRKGVANVDKVVRQVNKTVDRWVAPIYKNWANQKDGKFKMAVGAASTITVAAGKYIRIQELLDIGAGMRTIGLALSEDKVVCDQYKLTLELYSTAMFAVQSFAMIAENGENITATDADLSNSLSEEIDTATGSQTKDIIYGKILRSQINYQNGTPYYRQTLRLDLTNYCNKYLIDMKRKEMDETAPAYLEFRVGIGVIGIASQVVNVVATYEEANHLVPYRLPTML